MDGGLQQGSPRRPHLSPTPLSLTSTPSLHLCTLWTGQASDRCMQAQCTHDHSRQIVCCIICSNVDRPHPRHRHGHIVCCLHHGGNTHRPDLRQVHESTGQTCGPWTHLCCSIHIIYRRTCHLAGAELYLKACEVCCCVIVSCGDVGCEY